jgi:hypothetical protein
MTPERRRKICDLYHSASELAPAEGSAFLDEACGGDRASAIVSIAISQCQESFCAIRTPSSIIFTNFSTEVASQ